MRVLKLFLLFLMLSIIIIGALTLQSLLILVVVSLIKYLLGLTFVFTFKYAFACSLIVALLNILIKR